MKTKELFGVMGKLPKQCNMFDFSNLDNNHTLLSKKKSYTTIKKNIKEKMKT